MHFSYVFCFALIYGSVYSETLEECKKSECPVYEVIEIKETYEIRKYPAYKIAVARSDNVDGFLKARKKNFFKLFRYQQGANENNHSFPMVYPFITVKDIPDGQFTMIFFLPKALAKPPKPLDESIEIKEVPERLVYAVSADGHANPTKVIAMQDKLRDALTADGVDFDRKKFGVMEYNRINELWGRHFDVIYSETLDNCKKFECPECVVEKKKAYELRKYPAYKIAVARSDNIKGFLKARKKNFFKLYKYQQGANENHHRFPMVYPFISVFNVKKWTSGEEVKEEVIDDKFAMIFYLPKDLANPPKPLDKSIEVKDVPERLVYALSSPGHANPTKIFTMRETLRDALKDEGVDFDHTKFGVMEYNRINDLWGRHFDVIYRGKL